MIRMIHAGVLRRAPTIHGRFSVPADVVIVRTYILVVMYGVVVCGTRYSRTSSERVGQFYFTLILLCCRY